MRERLTISIVRGIFLFICAGLGVLLGDRLGDEVPLAWAAVPLCVLVGAIVVLVEALFSRASVATISAIVFGLLLGFAASALFAPVIDVIVERVELRAEPQHAPRTSLEMHAQQVARGHVKFFLQLVALTLFCYFGVTILLQTRNQFRFLIPFVELRPEVKGLRPLLVDSSVILGGQLARLAGTGFFESRLVVPGCVAAEIQRLADSGDKRKRMLGERGLRVLGELTQQRLVELLPTPTLVGRPVDDALLVLAHDESGRILTCDQKLLQRAALEGINTVFLPAVLAAIQPLPETGDRLALEIVRRGDEGHQGVGYLEDGTMVVVDGAAGALGKTLEVEVRRTVPTAGGRILFARGIQE